MEEKEDLAVKEGRIIHPKEAALRKKIGLCIMGLTFITLLAYEPARQAYGPVSFIFMAGWGVYQTGVRNL